MTKENMIQLDITIRNLAETLWQEPDLFPVWRKLVEAEKMTGKIMRGEEL